MDNYQLMQAMSISTDIDQQNSVIMNGAIQPQLWDAIMQPEVLESLFPTTVLAKALMAQFRLLKDQQLYETFLNYFCTCANSANRKANKISQH